MVDDGFTFQERQAIANRAKLPLNSDKIQGTDGPPAAPNGTKAEDLLKPTKDDPAEKSVHFGNLRVERDLLPQFLEAEKYLCKSPEGLNALHALENAKTTTTVHKVNDGNDLYNPNRGQINWDPKSGLLTADGKMQTPANGLLHEQGHAVECLYHNVRFIQQMSTPNQRHDNGEEQRNITWESKYSKELGEGTRIDHGGLGVDTKGPTSVEIIEPALQDKAKIAKALHDERFGLAVHGYSVPPGPGKGDDAIVPWDGEPHSGPIVHLNGGTVAQYVADPKGGPGQYQIYDVQKDLHGLVPPENSPRLTIDKDGKFPAKEQAVEREATGVGGR